MNKSVELDEAGRKALAEFQKASKAKARAEARADKAKAILREQYVTAEVTATGELSGVTSATIDGLTVLKLQKGSTSRLDMDTVLNANPELFDKAFRKTNYAKVIVVKTPV